MGGCACLAARARKKTRAARERRESGAKAALPSLRGLASLSRPPPISPRPRAPGPAPARPPPLTSPPPLGHGRHLPGRPAEPAGRPHARLRAVHVGTRRRRRRRRSPVVHPPPRPRRHRLLVGRPAARRLCARAGHSGPGGHPASCVQAVAGRPGGAARGDAARRGARAGRPAARLGLCAPGPGRRTPPERAGEFSGAEVLHRALAQAIFCLWGGKLAAAAAWARVRAVSERRDVQIQSAARRPRRALVPSSSSTSPPPLLSLPLLV